MVAQSWSTPTSARSRKSAKCISVAVCPAAIVHQSHIPPVSDESGGDRFAEPSSGTGDERPRAAVATSPVVAIHTSEYPFVKLAIESRNARRLGGHDLRVHRVDAGPEVLDSEELFLPDCSDFGGRRDLLLQVALSNQKCAASPRIHSGPVTRRSRCPSCRYGRISSMKFEECVKSWACRSVRVCALKSHEGDR
jgi:hypothetical protein